MNPVPKPRSRPKPPRGKTLHGHPLGYRPSCPKCRKRRAHNEAVAKRALLKQRAKSRAAIRRKGKPRFAKGRDPAKLNWVRGLLCDLAIRFPDFCQGRTEAAHTKSRGAGGTDAQVIPLCTWHHAHSHLIGTQTFEAAYYAGTTLAGRAELYQRQYERHVALGWKPGDA